MKNSFFDGKTAVTVVGSMGQNHARILKEISNLNYVVDVNEEQGNEMRRGLVLIGLQITKKYQI